MLTKRLFYIAKALKWNDRYTVYDGWPFLQTVLACMDMPISLFAIWLYIKSIF